MNTDNVMRSGTLERLCPVAGSMGEWLAVIDGETYLTWPASNENAEQRCRHFANGKRVRFQTDGQPTSVPVGRRAGAPVGPPTVRLLDVEDGFSAEGADGFGPELPHRVNSEPPQG